MDAREYTRRCYAHLEADDPVFPRLATVNPARWELGHVGWFQEYWCLRHGTAKSPGDPARCPRPSRLRGADALFDSSNVPHDTRWSLDLPDWHGIGRYLDETLEATLASLDRCGDEARYFHELALVHEHMHGEALLMTLQSLALPSPRGWTQAAADPSAAAGDLDVPGGTYEIGSDRSHAGERFVFDNERDAHEVVLAPFSIARRCVTEGEFAAFADDGGYARAALWSDAGRRWLAANGRSMPAYWRGDIRGYEVRQFDRWRALAPGAALQHVNLYEAEAFCTWAHRRLPREAEWEVAARRELPFGRDVWEWTETAFAPYPGFAPDPYADYSQPWFGDHHVIRGGSWATNARLLDPAMRNFYRPERHDMFVGVRTCALD